jgi:hypothetical protein
MTPVGLAALRRSLSGRLLDWGATLGLDRQEMWRRAQVSGARVGDQGFLQVLDALDLLSRTAIRLGRLVMPAQLPDLS